MIGLMQIDTGNVDPSGARRAGHRDGCMPMHAANVPATSLPVHVPRPVAAMTKEDTEEPGQRTAATYLKHTLASSWHIGTIAGIGVTVLAFWGFLAVPVALVFCEMMVVAAALGLRPLHRVIDAKLDRLERTKAAAARAALLGRMSAKHREELFTLERVVDNIRELVAARGPAAKSAIDDCRALLAAYVRLAIVHHASRLSIASTDKVVLQNQLRVLEICAATGSPRMRAVAERRMLIARKRAENWERSHESLEATAHELEMIGELIHFTHEQWLAPMDPPRTFREIDGIVASLHENHSTMRELVELLDLGEPIEPRVLELGRDTTAA
jgi:hypothetical protein